MQTKIFIAICILLLGSLTFKAIAQQLTVQGQVRSDTGEPLPGVGVFIKGTTQGTATDADGRYTVKADATATMLFSFVGFETAEVPVSGRTTIEVVMKPDLRTLDEIVVVGYGTQERADVTNAVSSVKAKDIQNIPIATPQTLLQGRAAGVQVVQNSGAPGGSVTVRIRGATSLNAGNDPLYVIDGVPVESGNASNLNRNSQTSALADINPNDIESMEILKDASASAIYGARAANGVVLITTKRGKSGVPAFTLNYYTGMQLDNKSTRPDKLNSAEFIELINEQRANALPGVTSLYAFVLPDSAKVIDTDWIEEVLRSAAISNYDFSLRGGENKLKYAVSAGYFDQDGIVINSSFKRFNTRVNIDYEASEKFKIGNSLMISRSTNNRTIAEDNTNSIIRTAIMKAPVMPVYNFDGSYFLDDASGITNPVAYANEVKYQTVNNRMIGNIYGEYTFIPGLSLKSTWGTDFLATKDDFFQPSKAIRGGATEGEAGYTQTFSWINENILTYTRTLNDIHRITLLAGYSQQKITEERILTRAIGYSTDNIATLNAAATPQTSNSSNTGSGIGSLFTRLNYIYRNKYLLEASLRRDGSSRFGRNNKYAIFPAVSAGWRVSEEAFMENLTVITDLKLRGSVGKTGNQDIGNFRSQGAFSINNGYAGMGGVAPTDLPNPDLTWESTTQYNVGLDLSILNDRVNIVADAYLKKTSDLLLEVQLPGTSGLGNSLQNIGSTENKGIELNLVTRNLTGNLSWTTNFNISWNRNKVTKLNQEGQELVFSRGNSGGFGTSLPLSVIRVGDPIGTFYGWNNLGVFTTSEENTAGLRNENASGYLFKGGDIRFDDRNGDNIINDADRVSIGNAQPKFTGGLTNTFAYRSLELTALFQYSYGNDVYNASRAMIENMTQFVAGSRTLLNRWRYPGDVSDVPRADHVDNGLNRRSSQRWIEDGSYLRLKTLTLSYNIPASLVARFKLQSLRVYVTGQNILTFTRYTGMDPEASAFNARPTDIGIDYGVYPQFRTYLAGVSLGF